MQVTQSSSFEATANMGTTGLVGTLGVQIIDNQGATVLARTTAGIAEFPVGFGTYETLLIAPATVGQYTIVWDAGPNDVATEDLVVVAVGTGDVVPIIPPSGPAPVAGPCQAWISGADVADCAGIEVSSGNEELLDQVAVEASMLLYLASGQQYSGACERQARPCYTRNFCLGEWGYWREWNGVIYDERGYHCGCGVLSEIDLPGYPVTQIVEVLIDGDVVDDATYEIVAWQTLRRIRNPADPDVQLHWPACQNLDRAVGEEGTWQVTYVGGVAPPLPGERAAAALGAELYRACPGTNAGACLLPSSVTQITRQGVTMDFAGFRSFGFDGGKRVWNTGMGLVDIFLNAYNPTGKKQPSAFWSPDAPYLAERVT